MTEYDELRSRSEYESCSDKPDNEIARVITIISSTIERIAPPGSTYRTETAKILTMWGATNAVCLSYLPGILNPLRSDVAADYVRSWAELIHADLFSDFLSMDEYLLGEG